jgi:cytochrome c-type biogenesis protein
MPASVELSFLVAFGAGILSFLSPCVLPLIPSYLSFVTGLSINNFYDKESSNLSRSFMLVHSLFFVLGFSLIFISLGASASYLGRILLYYQDAIRKIGGLLIIVFGIHLTGILNLTLLNREKKFHLTYKPAGYLGTVLVGVAFGAGWTPCIGPILGTILVMASTTKDLTQGIFLLSLYSMGLGLPFLLSALMIHTLMDRFGSLIKYFRYISLISGILLIIIGLLIFTNYLSILSSYLNNWLLPLMPFLKT